jgi:hypothetical protein
MCAISGTEFYESIMCLVQIDKITQIPTPFSENLSGVEMCPPSPIHTVKRAIQEVIQRPSYSSMN